MSFCSLQYTSVVNNSNITAFKSSVVQNCSVFAFNSCSTEAVLIFLIKEQLKYESEARTSKGAWEKKLTNTQRRWAPREKQNNTLLRRCLSSSVLYFSLLQRLDGKSKDISKIAADVTQNVSLRQGMERKKVMQHIRGLYKTDLSASRHWQELVQQLTHDRSASLQLKHFTHVIIDSCSSPCDVVFPCGTGRCGTISHLTPPPGSWIPPKGHNRERRRLQRCYLTIPNKYLLKDRHKLDGERQALQTSTQHFLFSTLSSMHFHAAVYLLKAETNLSRTCHFSSQEKYVNK